MVSLTCNLEKQQIISLSKYRNSSNAQYFVNILSWNDREGMVEKEWHIIPSQPFLPSPCTPGSLLNFIKKNQYLRIKMCFTMNSRINASKYVLRLLAVCYGQDIRLDCYHLFLIVDNIGSQQTNICPRSTIQTPEKG